MSCESLESKIGRRTVPPHSAGIGPAPAAAGAGRSQPSLAAGDSIKIGFLAPLTGPFASWGKPGLDGCLIWADWVNAKGGVKIGRKLHKIEFVGYDDEYDATKAQTGATVLIKEHGVKFVMMLGGDTWSGVQQLAEHDRMLFSTLLPSDLSPKAQTLIAPCEVHPIYNVTGVEWLAENKPDLKTAAICALDDAFGKPAVATYLAAFEAAGIEMVDKPEFFDPATTDLASLMAKLLANNPDILCLDTCPTDYVHLLCEQAFQQGYDGQIISCTADHYQKIIEKTSKEFMEGFIFQFPDFDDPALNAKDVNFEKPNEFYAEYVQRHGAERWSSVSWEYASIMDFWADAATRASSAEPLPVLRAAKEAGTGKHAFGGGFWWGPILFGIDNALVGDWPVVAIENGKARIKAFKSIPDWLHKHGKLLRKHLWALEELWIQRRVRPPSRGRGGARMHG